MSGNWIGGDVDEMRALGDTFAQQATLLRTGTGRLTASVAGIVWEGADLELFVQDWQARHRPALLTAATLLETQQAVLVANADAQTLTSSEGGAIAGPTTGPPGKQVGPKPTATAALLDQMRDVLDDPAALAAWWASLSEREVDRLIAANPALVLSLGDLLDPAEYQAALDAYLQQVYDDSTIASQSWEVGGSVSVPVYKVLSVELAADLGLDLVETGDGYQVVVRGGGALGVSVGEPGSDGAQGGLVGAELLNGLGGDLTYSFDSLAEAEAFMEQLQYAAVPDNPLEWIEGGAGVLTSGMTPILGTYLAREVGEVLVANGSSLTEMSGSVSQTLSGTGGAAGFSVAAEATVSHDVTNGSTTFRGQFGVEGQTGVTIPGVPTQGSGVMGAELTVDSAGNPTTLRVTADGQMLLGGVVDPGLVAGLSGNSAGFGIGGDVGSGVGGSASIEIDLTDPRNAVAGQQVLDALAAGDLHSAQQGVADLYENSAIVVQTTSVSTTEVGVDLSVVGVSGSYEQANQTGLWVKPPGGSEFHDAAGRQ